MAKSKNSINMFEGMEPQDAIGQAVATMKQLQDALGDEVVKIFAPKDGAPVIIVGVYGWRLVDGVPVADAGEGVQ